MDSSYNCVICLEDLNMDDGVLTPCNHRYHSKCFFKWIFKKRSCPLCREELIAKPNHEEHESLNELRRQINWESSLYDSLRKNTDTLEKYIYNQREKLQDLNSRVISREKQLVQIIDRYKQIMSNAQRRRRGGLLFR